MVVPRPRVAPTASLAEKSGTAPVRVWAAPASSSGARGRALSKRGRGTVLIMRMIRGDEGGVKERSVWEAEQPGDGEIFVEVRPVDPERAADQLPAFTGRGRRVPKPGKPL